MCTLGVRWIPRDRPGLVQCCNAAILRCCNTAMLQYCNAAMLRYCNAAILQCCNTARHCSAVVRHAPRAAVNAAATDWSGLNFAQDFGFRGEAS